jgi:hypothetical protein
MHQKLIELELNMKNDFNTDDYDIKLDANGMIDLEYYYIKSDEMRAEYLIALYRNTKQYLKATLKSFYERFICINCHSSQ